MRSRKELTSSSLSIILLFYLLLLLGIVDLAEARLLGHVLALGGFGSSRRATSLRGVFGL